MNGASSWARSAILLPAAMAMLLSLGCCHFHRECGGGGCLLDGCGSGGCEQGACDVGGCGPGGCPVPRPTVVGHVANKLQCASGCGEFYLGGWLSDPPAPCEPCGCEGPCVGHCKGHFVGHQNCCFPSLRSLWGIPYCGGCESGCRSCRHAGAYVGPGGTEGFVEGVWSGEEYEYLDGAYLPGETFSQPTAPQQQPTPAKNPPPAEDLPAPEAASQQNPQGPPPETDTQGPSMQREGVHSARGGWIGRTRFSRPPRR